LSSNLKSEKSIPSNCRVKPMLFASRLTWIVPFTFVNINTKIVKIRQISYSNLWLYWFFKIYVNYRIQISFRLAKLVEWSTNKHMADSIRYINNLSSNSKSTKSISSHCRVEPVLFVSRLTQIVPLTFVSINAEILKIK